MCLVARALYDFQRCLASLSAKSDFILFIRQRTLLLPSGKIKILLGGDLLSCVTENRLLLVLLVFLVCFFKIYLCAC